MNFWARINEFFGAVFDILYEVALDFWEKDCYTKASTLTFYTLLSIVPFLAAILAIAKGFGFDENLKELLTSTFVEQKEILTDAVQIALKMLDYISRGEIVGIGVILLLWTNINLMSYIEYVFNEIWRVKFSRSYFQKFEDFLFAVVIFPLILVTSSSVTFYVKSQIYYLSYFSMLNQILILPWLLSCVLFGLLYFIIPNAKIRIVPRLVASAIAGTAFQAWQIVFINLQLYIFSYNAIYGAFALLPLFLIWLQFSWIIALAGALISYHMENYKENREFKMRGIGAQITQDEMGLLVLLDCLSEFYEGSPPISVTQLSERLGLRQSVVTEVLSQFEKHHILFSFYNKDNEVCYHPLKNPDSFKISDVLNIVEHRQDVDIMIQSTHLLEYIRTTLQGLHKASKDSSNNLNFHDFFQNLKNNH